MLNSFSEGMSMSLVNVCVESVPKSSRHTHVIFTPEQKEEQ